MVLLAVLIGFVMGCLLVSIQTALERRTHNARLASYLSKTLQNQVKIKDPKDYLINQICTLDNLINHKAI